MGLILLSCMFLIWWIPVWHGAQEEGVCWNCFSPLRRGAPVEVSPQQRRRQQRCGEQWHSNGSGKGILATTAWHSLIAASLAFFLLFFFIDFHIELK